MRSIDGYVVRATDSHCQVATVLDSIPASSDTVASEGQLMKKCSITYFKKTNKINCTEEAHYEYCTVS